MKKITLLLSAVVFAMVATSCTVIEPLAASAAPVGSKTGVSKTAYIFTFRTNSSFGIAEAAHLGGITGGVSYADRRTSRSPFKFIFYKEKITVNGN